MIFFLSLPWSGHRLRIPAMRSITGLESTPGRGARPDVEVRLTVEDIASGRDPVLEAALDLAAR